MQSLDLGPRHLAEVVLRALSVGGGDVPDSALLVFFFDVLYQASFRVELGQQTRGSILWQDPAALLSSLPTGFSSQGVPAWRFLSLTHPIPFNVSSLVSLLQGTDPRLSALAAYADTPDSPVIYGLVHYGADLVRPVSEDAEDQGRPSGSFRADILGPAHLLVDVGFEHPLELKRNHLHTHAQAVLRRGPVRDRLSTFLHDLFPDLKAQLPPEIVSSPFFEAPALPLAGGSILINDYDWSELLERLWIDTLVRILQTILLNRQGGAVLVTSERAGTMPVAERLSLPYAASYSHLRLLLEQRSLFAIRQQVLAAKALSEQALPLRDLSPDDLALQSPEWLAGPVGSDEAIRQAVIFLASLARLEGLLLLTPQLDLKGFGGQANAAWTPEEVYLASDELATEAGLSVISLRSFGPRNQALIRQCHQDHDAIAFALTQDSDLRVMMWLEGKVVVWDRASLHRL